MKIILASISALLLSASLAAAGGAGCDYGDTSASKGAPADGVVVPGTATDQEA